MTPEERILMNDIQTENRRLCERIEAMNRERVERDSNALKLYSEHQALRVAYRLLEEEFSAYKRSVAGQLEVYEQAASDASEDAEIFYRAYHHLKQETA